VARQLHKDRQERCGQSTLQRKRTEGAEMNGAAKQSHMEAAEEIIDTMTILTTMEGALTDSPLAEVEKRFYVRQIREELLVRLASFALENELESMDNTVN
jgi:hypothetical protein